MSRVKECEHCGAAMQQGQDWCVQCGAARRGRLPRRPGWLTGAGVLIAIALLVAGASVAAYAALSERAHKARAPLALRSPTVAQATVPPVGGGTGTAGKTGTGTTGKTPALPSGSAPPKIPTQTPTPEGSGGSQGGANPLFPPESSKSSKANKGSGKAGKSNTSGSKGSSKGSGKGGGEEGAGAKGSGTEGSSNESKSPAPILLDTNAASTYDPNAYPASQFGDPSLAIDGEVSTAWTAAVPSAGAPHVAIGLALDLRSAQKLASVKVQTSTPGITVEVFAANGHALPATIADPAWKKLHGPRLLKKKDVTFKLKTKGAAYRFVLLWIVKAPPSSTPADPGHVAINELELFSSS